MKNIFSVLFIAFLAGCQISSLKVDRDPAQDRTTQVDTAKIAKKEFKTYLKNISVPERNEILQKARVTDKKFDPAKVSSIDLIQELQAECGDEYHYAKINMQRNNVPFETYTWPKVDCTYHPDDSLGGGSSKFLCDFSEGTSGDYKTRKVKYVPPGEAPNAGEVLETTIAPMMARLIGFHAEGYCPAEVICKNCSSENPWKKKRSTAGPSSKTYSFPISVVEFPRKGMTVSNKDTHPYVQGIEWYELRQARGETPVETRQLLIEREAWMLWLNFIQNTDAGSYNERLSCLDLKIKSDGKPECTDSIMYSHDYGHSFYRNFDFQSWAARPPFQNNRPGEACRGNMTMKDLGLNKHSHFAGLILSPAISSEARDLLVQRLELVTDVQWLTAFKIGRIEELLGITSNDWLTTLKKKIEQMKTASCLPFDTHTSSLASP